MGSQSCGRPPRLEDASAHLKAPIQYDSVGVHAIHNADFAIQKDLRRCKRANDYINNIWFLVHSRKIVYDSTRRFNAIHDKTMRFHTTQDCDSIETAGRANQPQKNNQKTKEKPQKTFRQPPENPQTTATRKPPENRQKTDRKPTENQSTKDISMTADFLSVFCRLVLWRLLPQTAGSAL